MAHISDITAFPQWKPELGSSSVRFEIQGEESQHATSAYGAQELSAGADDSPKISQLYTHELEGEQCSQELDAVKGAYNPG